MKKANFFLNVVLSALLIAPSFMSMEAHAQAPKDAPPAVQPPATPAPPPPAAAPVPPANDTAKPATEVIENPYGIEALWLQGDFVARGTLIIR